MIGEALREGQVEREQVECLAIGIGPGSYTGIRSAIALAQGWQLASRPGGIRLLGVSSAECLAAQAHAEGLKGRVTVVIDAQREEFYLAGYDLSAEGRREIEPLRLGTLRDAQARQTAGDIIVGPEVTKWLPSGRVIFPRAAALGELALGRTDFVAAEELAPIYLRETRFVKAPPPRALPQ
jgi:tRNA threonylcarbamoyl adenosine modification protein YeaZ